MPELPEVETIRRDLMKKILNKKIVHVKVFKDKAVDFATAKFVQALTGNKIVDIERRGKLMVFRLAHTIVIPSEPRQTRRRGIFRSPEAGLINLPDTQKDFSPDANRVRNDRGTMAVLVHLKMTGQLIYERKVDDRIEVVAGGHKLVENDFDLPNKHTQVVISFVDGGRLFFNDLRRFGYMKLAGEDEIKKALGNFGIEPLTKDFTWKNFESVLGKRKVSIKVVLMGQKKIAGIGNIYADEICFCSGVLPTRAVSSLTVMEKKKIFGCTSQIIKQAIKHRGTTFKDYMDTEGKKGNFTNFLKVFDRKGEKCLRCKGEIQKIKSNGRGTHFCPHCQR